MMSASDVAKLTIGAVRERNCLNHVENLIIEAAKTGEHVVNISLEECNEIFNCQLTENDVSISARWPVALRLVRT